MNVRRAINLLFAVLVAGFLLGLVPALGEAVSNRYLHFKAYRLIALAFSGTWNRALAWGGGGVVLFCLIWLLVRLTARTDPDRTTRITAGAAVLGAVLWIGVRRRLWGGHA